eukprot:3540075-Amphidinium_carterae.1
MNGTQGSLLDLYMAWPCQQGHSRMVICVQSAGRRKRAFKLLRRSSEIAELSQPVGGLFSRRMSLGRRASSPTAFPLES